MKKLGVDEIVPWPFLNLSRSTDEMLPDMVIKIGQWSVCLVFGTMCLYFVFGMGSSPVSVFWYLVFGMASSPVSGTRTSLG